MVIAQIEGKILISWGAMAYSVDTNAFTCVFSEWLVLIGYTIALFPILIKVHTINKISHQSKRFQRIHSNGNKLLRYPLYAMIPVLFYLIVWTTVDRPKVVDTLSMDTDNESVILIKQNCSSSSGIWLLISYMWQLLLLSIAAILAIQSGDTNEEMNEKQLGVLVYSQFLFLVLRVLVTLSISLTTSALGSDRSQILGIILSVDVICSIAIYMGPKFYLCFITDQSNISVRGSMKSTRSSFNSRRSSMRINRRMSRRMSNFVGDLENVNEVMNLKRSSTRDIMKTLGIKVSEAEETHSTMSSLNHLRRNGISVIKPKNDMLEMLKKEIDKKFEN